jgi:hypothetical protein
MKEERVNILEWNIDTTHEGRNMKKVGGKYEVLTDNHPAPRYTWSGRHGMFGKRFPLLNQSIQAEYAVNPRPLAHALASSNGSTPRLG